MLFKIDSLFPEFFGSHRGASLFKKEKKLDSIWPNGSFFFKTWNTCHWCCENWVIFTLTSMKLMPQLYTLAECIWRELAKMRLGECDSLHSCWELSIHKRWEQGEGVQTRAKLRPVLEILVFFFQSFGVFLFQNHGFFEILTFFFFENYNLSECICRLFLSDECVDEFGAWHKARHETLWLVHRGTLKKLDLNEERHECRGYTRGSKARRVFPSTFSLSPCIGFPRRECTAGIRRKAPHVSHILQFIREHVRLLGLKILRIFSKFGQKWSLEIGETMVIWATIIWV